MGRAFRIRLSDRLVLHLHSEARRDLHPRADQLQWRERSDHCEHKLHNSCFHFEGLSLLARVGDTGLR